MTTAIDDQMALNDESRRAAALAKLFPERTSTVAEVHTAIVRSQREGVANLRDAADFHRGTLKRLGRSTSTLRLYRIYQDSYLTYLSEHEVDPALEALTPQVVRKWQAWLRAKSLGRRGGQVTEKMGVQILKTWARFLWENDVYPVDPLARLKIPRVQKIHRKPFTEDEVRRLIQATATGANPIRDRALLLLMFDTGCRVGELCAATLSDVDLVEGSILFRRTKGGRPRTVKFIVQGRQDGGSTLVALKNWLRVREVSVGVDALFIGREHEPLSTRRVREIFVELGQVARVRNAHPHRARHTAATEFLAERPGAEIQLRSRLGQVSREVLSDYVTISDRTAVDMAEVASLSTKWDLGSGRHESRRAHPPLALQRGSGGSTQQDLLELLVSDPTMRQKLLELLLKRGLA